MRLKYKSELGLIYHSTTVSGITGLLTHLDRFKTNLLEAFSLYSLDNTLVALCHSSDLTALFVSMTASLKWNFKRAHNRDVANIYKLRLQAPFIIY